MTRQDLLWLTAQLNIMIKAGVDLAEAMKSIAEHSTHPVLGPIVAQVHADIEDGESVAAALRKHKEIFGEAYVASIAAGEASGTMNEILDRMSTLLRHEIRLSTSIKSVLAYPLILLTVATLVISGLLFFVLPQFSEVFTTLDRPAPPMTQLLLDLGHFIKTHAQMTAVGVIGGACLMIRLWWTEGAKQWRDHVLLNGRLFRRGIRPLFAGRSFTLMGTLLQSGVPLVDSIRLCRTSISSRLFRTLFDDMERDVVNGRGISGALRKAAFVPDGAAQMIATGEHTGRLGAVMQTIGEFYEDEGEAQVKQIVKLMEPAIIVVMGVVVSGVVMAVMLPLLDVSTTAQ